MKRRFSTPRGLPSERDVHYENWSRSVSFTAQSLAKPRSEEEVAEVVARAADAGLAIRPVGSGHSSTPLMATEDVLLSLDTMAGVVDHDAEANVATVLPGTGLADLGGQLEEAGLALENYGDVDYQAIAGALGTGTHGTGETLGNLSSNLIGGRLVTGTGDVVPFGVDAGEREDSDLVRAAQVSLGALGVLTSLTLRVVPAYNLRRNNWMTHIDWVLDHFDELAATYRHVDFYWYPRSDHAQVRVLDVPEKIRDLQVPGTLHTLSEGPSYEVLPNHQEIQFEEIEYMLPRAAALDAFREVRARIKQRHRSQVAWRVLVRTIAPDRAMLSNSQDRDTMTIALLHNAGLPYKDYFFDIESIFLEYDGRPHWGKKHTRLAEHLRPMYPHWDRFEEIRRELDPGGVFMNDYLRRLLVDGKDS